MSLWIKFKNWCLGLSTPAQDSTIQVAQITESVAEIVKEAEPVTTATPAAEEKPAEKTKKPRGRKPQGQKVAAPKKPAAMKAKSKKG